MILCDHCGQKATKKDYLIQFADSPALASFDLCDKCKGDIEKTLTKTITDWKEKGKDPPQPQDLPQASKGLRAPWQAHAAGRETQGIESADPSGRHTPAHQVESIPSGIPLPEHADEKTDLEGMGVRRPAVEQGSTPPSFRGDKPELDPKNPEAAQRETREARATRLEAEHREAKARKEQEEQQKKDEQKKGHSHK